MEAGAARTNEAARGAALWRLGVLYRPHCGSGRHDAHPLLLSDVREPAPVVWQADAAGASGGAVTDISRQETRG